MLRRFESPGCPAAVEMFYGHRDFAPGLAGQKIGARNPPGLAGTPGLNSLTGGGAEIFRKDVRSAIAKGKESAEEYLDVHRTWHQMGERSTCTMLYGHVETLETEWITSVTCATPG